MTVNMPRGSLYGLLEQSKKELFVGTFPPFTFYGTIQLVDIYLIVGKHRRKAKRVRPEWEFKLYKWFSDLRGAYCPSFLLLSKLSSFSEYSLIKIFVSDVFAPLSLGDVQLKARTFAGNQVPSDFQFSFKWLYGFLRFFRISCRIAADSASSDRLDVEEIKVID